MKTTFPLPAFGAMCVQPPMLTAKPESRQAENDPVFFGSRSGAALRAMTLGGLLAVAPMVAMNTASAREINDSTQAEAVQSQGAEELTLENFEEKTRGLPSQVLLYRGRADNKPIMDFLAEIPQLKGKMNFFVYSLDQPGALNLELKDDITGENVPLPPSDVDEALILMNSRGELAYILATTNQEGTSPTIGPDDEELKPSLISELERYARILTIPDNPSDEK